MSDDDEFDFNPDEDDEDELDTSFGDDDDEDEDELDEAARLAEAREIAKLRWEIENLKHVHATMREHYRQEMHAWFEPLVEKHRGLKEENRQLHIKLTAMIQSHHDANNGIRDEIAQLKDAHKTLGLHSDDLEVDNRLGRRLQAELADADAKIARQDSDIADLERDCRRSETILADKERDNEVRRQELVQTQALVDQWRQRYAQALADNAAEIVMYQEQIRESTEQAAILEVRAQEFMQMDHLLPDLYTTLKAEQTTIDGIEALLFPRAPEPVPEPVLVAVGAGGGDGPPDRHDQAAAAWPESGLDETEDSDPAAFDADGPADDETLVAAEAELLDDLSAVAGLDEDATLDDRYDALGLSQDPMNDGDDLHAGHNEYQEIAQDLSWPSGDAASTLAEAGWDPEAAPVADAWDQEPAENAWDQTPAAPNAWDQEPTLSDEELQVLGEDGMQPPATDEAADEPFTAGVWDVPPPVASGWDVEPVGDDVALAARRRRDEMLATGMPADEPDEAAETEFAYNTGHEPPAGDWQVEDDDIVIEDLALEDDGDIVVLDDDSGYGDGTFQYNDDQDARALADDADRVATADAGVSPSGAVAIPGFDDPAAEAD
jgi:hypothetical protein